MTCCSGRGMAVNTPPSARSGASDKNYIVLIPGERLEAYAIDSRFGRGGYMRRVVLMSVCTYLQDLTVLLGMYLYPVPEPAMHSGR